MVGFKPFKRFNLSRIRHRASDGLANAMWRGLISLWLSFCMLSSNRSKRLQAVFVLVGTSRSRFTDTIMIYDLGPKRQSS